MIWHEEVPLLTVPRTRIFSPQNLVIFNLPFPRPRVPPRSRVLPLHVVRWHSATRTHRCHLFQCKLCPEPQQPRISLLSELTLPEAIPPLETVQNVLVLRIATVFTLLCLVNHLHREALGHRHLVVFRNVLSCPLLLPNPM